MSQDMTIVYYTANAIPEKFHEFTKTILQVSAEGTPIVSVSKKPMDLGTNIVVDSPRSTINIYRQALIGAKAAKTKYIAMAEDDALYPPDHFKHRPSDDAFAYNMSQWGLYTWVEPAMYSHKGRHVLYSMVCNRELFIETMEARFEKYPVDEEIVLKNWGEPGKYERHLGLPEVKMETFNTGHAIVVFSHETALAYGHLGKRKKLGNLRCFDIPYWGKAEELKKRYE